MRREILLLTRGSSRCPNVEARFDISECDTPFSFVPRWETKGFAGFLDSLLLSCGRRLKRLKRFPEKG